MADPWKGRMPPPSVRDMSELAGVLAVPGCHRTGPAYFMYRDLARSGGDHRWLRAQELRYDITVIPPQDLCGEFVKTKGHYHPENPAGTGYPEVYEVLAGEAHYLLQARDCHDVVMVGASAGDIVVVPPGYGHVTINPSQTEVLRMANLVSSAFRSDYQPYEDLHGAVFYEMTGGTFIKNPRYPQEVVLRITRADRIPAVNGVFTAPLYDLVEQRAPVLGLLNHPEEFGEIFSAISP